MKTYVLGPNAARKLKGLFAGQGKVGSRKIGTPGVAFDSEYAAPYTVQWAQSANDGAGAWIIWLPSDELLLVGGEAIDCTADIEAVGGNYPDGWYKLDFLDPDAGGKVYLNVYFSDCDGGESDAEDNPTPEPAEDVTVEFAGEKQEPEDETVVSILIAECDGKMVKQIVSSVIVIGGPSHIPVDERSIDNNGGKYDEHKLQIAHFGDAKKDSGKGLVKRLKANPETGEITARDSEGLMLVARKNGNVIYIPLNGDGEDPEPELDPDRGCDDHPGGGDAVNPNGDDDERKHGGYSVGGVPAESGDSVPGFGAVSCCS